MQSIFFLFIFVVSFCCGAFAQNVSDEAVSTESSGKSLDASAGSAGTVDTDVVPKADIPDAGVPAPAYGGDDNDLSSKENSSADTKDLATDDGTTAEGDYDKPSKSMPGPDADIDTDASGSGNDAGAPAKSEPSDTYGD